MSNVLYFGLCRDQSGGLTNGNLIAQLSKERPNLMFQPGPNGEPVLLYEGETYHLTSYRAHRSSANPAKFSIIVKFKSEE